MRVLNLILPVILATSCGTEDRPKRVANTGDLKGGTTTGFAADGTPCSMQTGLPTKECPIYTQTPVQSGVPVYTATVGASPDSYTFLDTPDANLCVDAFIRQGVTLPANIVARSVNSFNVRSNGIAWRDDGVSDVPVLNVLHLDSKFSNVIFQLLNPIGYYCIVKNSAEFSDVTIQRKCTAGLAEIEPITQVTVNEPVAKRGFFAGLFCRQSIRGELDGTTTSYNSRITEAQCIQ